MRGNEGVREHERDTINSRWGNKELLSMGLQNCRERRATEKAVLLLVRAAERAAGESDVP